jgi:leucyl aminopeptidase
MVKIRSIKGDLATVKADAVVVNLFQDVKSPGGATGAIDKALGGAIKELLALGDFKGKASEATMIPTRGAIGCPRVLLIGLGKKDEFNLDTLRNVAARSAQIARDRGWKRLASVLHGAGIGGIDAERAAQAFAEGALMGVYDFKEFKSKPKEDDEPATELEEIVVVEQDAKKLPKVKSGLEAGVVLAESVNLARDLINRPSIAKPPTAMAKLAANAAQRHGVKATILDEKQLKSLGMGLLLGVGSGAGPGRGPRLVVLEHPGKGAKKKTILLVGKGITFDSGGINIKPSQGLERMKYDMGGSATVLGTMLAAARLKVPQRVVGLMALAENMPSGTAIRPGDVLTAFDGTRVEVGNTDAEGRLVLGDALAYGVKEFKPDVILDAATLTGAVKVALGGIMTGVLGNDEALIAQLTKAGKACGEDLWPLPITPEYEKQIKSDVADISNMGPGGAGTIMGAVFLKKFIGPTAKWTHFDIAGTGWTDKGGGDLKKDYLPKGPTGVIIRTWIEWLRRHA